MTLFQPAREEGSALRWGAEHDILAQQGVLERLAGNCRGERPFSLIYHRPTGGAEIITAVTPLPTPLGCRAVVASFSEDAFEHPPIIEANGAGSSPDSLLERDGFELPVPLMW